MCTVTWWRSPGGYELFFNRDELHRRREARPPRVHRAGTANGADLRFLAPEDGDFGGSWISVNEGGLSLGILNGFRAPDSAVERDYRSRGLLLTDLASCRTPEEVASRLAGEDTERYRSFRLLAIAPGVPLLLAEWDRRAVAVDADAEARIPVISSAIEESEVGRRRRREFERVVGRDVTVERLLAFHRSHANGPSSYSVCMHREDAGTRSFTRVSVTPEEVSMTYRPGPPCEAGTETVARLRREEAS